MRARWMVVLLVAGCMSGPIERLRPEAPYVPADYQWSTVSGLNTVSGHAGGVIPRGPPGRTGYCYLALLTPVGPQTEEVKAHNYGSGERGIIRSRSSRRPTLMLADLPLQKLTRQAKCEGGDFIFRDIPDGAYFLEAIVSWSNPTIMDKDSNERDTLMQRVEVAGGETVRVNLSNQNYAPAER